MLSTNFYFNTRSGRHWREPEPPRTEVERPHTRHQTRHIRDHTSSCQPHQQVSVSILYTQELRLGEVKSSAQAHTAEPVKPRGRPGVSNMRPRLGSLYYSKLPVCASPIFVELNVTNSTKTEAPLMGEPTAGMFSAASLEFPK